VTPYAGPVIDAHHHLWPDDAALVPWLDAELHAAGSIAEHGSTFAGRFVATVWIEGVARDPEAELRAAETVRQTTGGRLCTALVAHAPLDAEDLPARLNRLEGITPALRGIRDILAPGSFARADDLLARSGFAAGLAELAQRKLAFDLMLRPAQMDAAADVIAEVEGLRVAVEHAGAPHDTSAAGIALWERGMARLAELPHVIVKVSALQCLDPTWTDQEFGRLMERLRALFGAKRMAMGTDWPVHDLHCTSPRALATFRRLVSGWSTQEQRAFFHDTATNFYQIGTGDVRVARL
jgi:L-fuconolactonase